MHRRTLLAGALACLTACGADEDKDALSPEESRQLDEAAAMLDNAADVPVSEDAAANTTEQTVIIDPVMNE